MAKFQTALNFKKIQQEELATWARIGLGTVVFVLLLMAGPATIIAQSTLYVDADATGANNGSSWGDAYTFLQDALSVASSGDQIWVAEGVYYPDEGSGFTENDRTATFQLKTGVAIYGGFVGNENSLNGRDWEANPTILSGDIDGNDDPYDPDSNTDNDTNTPSQTDHIRGNNSYHVTNGSDTDATAVLDGFIMTGGQANGSNSESTGGGMYNSSGSPKLTNLILSGNSAVSDGGGIYNANSNPILTDVRLTGNSAQERGGGIYNTIFSNPIITNVAFSINLSDWGGGMFNGTSSPILTNVSFTENRAVSLGGGLANEGSSPTLVNVSFSGNIANQGGWVSNGGSSNPMLINVTFTENQSLLSGGAIANVTSSNPTLINVILWENQANESTTTESASIYNDTSTPIISHSLIANSGGSGSWNTAFGTDGGNNLDTDPQFTDPGNGDYTLTSTSPGINAGSNQAYTDAGGDLDTDTDLAGNPRLFDGSSDPDVIDMGAYEFQGESSSISPDGNNILFVDRNVSGGNGNGSSWTNAISELADALKWAREQWDGGTAVWDSENPLNIWVADGTYQPLYDAADEEYTVDGGRDNAFVMVEFVDVYGGFAGTEDPGTFNLDNRDFEANETILSGDVNGDDEINTSGWDLQFSNKGENTYHVVIGAFAEATTMAILDGFTVEGGNADNTRGLGPININGEDITDGDGGGIYLKTGTHVINNNLITHHSARTFGGGIFASGDQAIVRLDGNRIIENGATSGGGLYLNENTNRLTQNLITGNIVSGQGGGLILVAAKSTLVNNLIEKNRANLAGGLNIALGSAYLTNSTFYQNRSEDEGGGILANNATLTIQNSVFHANEESGETNNTGSDIENFQGSATINVDYSLTQVWNTGTGNIVGSDPQFTDPANGDYTLTSGSPAVNAGNNQAYTDAGGDLDTDTDLAGNPRLFDGSPNPDVIDMGAYEFQGEPAEAENPFITTWQTDNDGDSDNESIRIPMIGNGYDFKVDWGDGNTSSHIINPGTRTQHFLEHTYSAAGEYEVKITGSFPRIYFQTGGDKQKLLTIKQWGDIQWTSMQGAFFGASNLTYKAKDAPDLSAVTDMTGMFANASKFNGDLSNWDVSNVELMPSMFSNARSFNGNLSSWKVGNVTNMFSMFSAANSFNQDLTNWDVSSVKNLSSMFLNASNFNGDLSNWKMGSVESTMQNMFAYASSFNGDISGWDVRRVTNMGGMFQNASNFNGDLSNWNVSNVELMNNMFFNASSFNGDLSEKTVNANQADEYTAWNVSNVTNMGGMFKNAGLFNNNLGNWDVSGVTNMEEMLDGSGLSTTNYDATLSGWAGLNDLQTNVTLGAEGLGYCSSQFARQMIIDTYGWEITGDSFSCPPPTASNGRVLAVSTTPYRFTESDFNLSGLGDAIKVETSPDKGILQFNGGPLADGQEITIDELKDKKLRWLPTSEYGYGYTSFEYRSVITGDKASEETYTLTIDLGAGLTELNGVEGWRFLTNPSGGDSFDDLLQPIWTRGLPGSDDPSASFANVYTLDQPNYQWDIPSSMDETTETGEPFIVYVFSDDDDDGNPEGFPKTLVSAINWIPVDGSFSFDNLRFDEDPANPDNFFLIGNPHPFGIDICEMFDSASSGLANNISVWDPEANGANGDYILLSCSAEQVRIPPFQSFWVRTVADNPSLGVTKSSYLSGPETGNLKENELKLPLLTLKVTHQENHFTSRTRILFSDQGEIGLDPFDGPRLSPEGLAANWLSFTSQDQDGRSYAIQSLPPLTEDQILIPLDIHTTEAGTFSLDWQLPESHHVNTSYYLRDNHIGEIIELKKGNTYSFEIEGKDVAHQKQADGPMAAPMQALSHSHGPVESHPRFELLITTDGSDGYAGLGDLPEMVTLNQNYPNPFNPTTVISYELPQSANVKLDVYDMTGRQVATLVNGQVAAGRHTVNFDASRLSSGVYLYRLQAGSSIQTRKLTILK
jgi:surface protein